MTLKERTRAELRSALGYKPEAAGELERLTAELEDTRRAVQQNYGEACRLTAERDALAKKLADFVPIYTRVLEERDALRLAAQAGLDALVWHNPEGLQHSMWYAAITQLDAALKGTV